MKIWLLRHGQAKRWRSVILGCALTEQAGSRLRRCSIAWGKRLDTILAVLRNQQTAALFRHWRDKGIATAAWLTPEDEPRHVLDFLAERVEQHLLLVSHQPLLGQLISLLVDGHKGTHHPMPTAGLACIQMDFPAAGIGQLLLLTCPAELSD
jgi:phosphohistidine phosphatase